ncbi:uncharacterized protein ASPGLDRAFT_48513 [Aspergillus glaucus CBS 516.65]|uniref:Uncharacterized protein n=1 Tax=Aspergillus glaucus CBS 516.65 TaxID=1160497 RepID=A0A1L9VGU1_ASPGL|nr:hypothetical protein ASPGLDRAFT_48513 [Aspergillus glaucus CBS 516.65]OJJ83136.1 hypothetical protein ASPGLDRAFT_48513 [Aspergillus glaucus CBS 516.65]
MGLRPGGRVETGPGPGTRALYQIKSIPPSLTLTGYSEMLSEVLSQYTGPPPFQLSIEKLPFP